MFLVLFTFLVLIAQPLDKPSLASSNSVSKLAQQLQPLNSLAATLPPTTSPQKVMLVGASVALTLGIGLSQDAPQYGFTLVDDATLGCGIAQGEPLSVQGQIWNTVTSSCDGSTTDLQWPLIWANQVSQVNPQVVILEVGRWEVVNRYLHGVWSNITETTFQNYILAQLQLAIEILGATGAHIILLTSPYFQGNYPEDSYERVNIFNQLLGQIASQYPEQTSLIDLNSYVDPGGYYAEYKDGIQIRQSDGVHFTPQGGVLIGKWLWPQISQAVSSSTSSSNGSFPSSYDLLTTRGQVIRQGSQNWFGDTFQFPPAGSTQSVNSPPPGYIVSFGQVRNGNGYWLVGSNGAVYAFGDAGFFGPGNQNYALFGTLPYQSGLSLGSQGVKSQPATSTTQPLKAPPPTIAPSPRNFHLRSPIVAFSPTSNDKGYWLVASDGSIYPFGDAPSFKGKFAYSAPIVAFSPTSNDKGYWLVASDGSIYPFGDAPMLYSYQGVPLQSSALGILTSS